MAAWEPKKLDLTQINNGQEYNDGDGVGASSVNAAVESAAWAQNYAESLTAAPDLTEAGNVGSPTVSFVDNGNYKKFKFSNLKGDTGATGADALFYNNIYLSNIFPNVGTNVNLYEASFNRPPVLNEYVTFVYEQSGTNRSFICIGLVQSVQTGTGIVGINIRAKVETTGDKGDKGDTGDKGDKGDKGDTGISVKDVDFIYNSESSTEVVYDVKTTLDDNTIVDSGQVEIPKSAYAVDPDAVHYTAQTLTSEQQAQARTNIGAAPTGNYALQDGTYSEMTVGNATNAENASHATAADSATTATNATNAETADKVENSLTFINANGGTKTYNGAAAQTIDLAPTVTTAYAEIGSNTRWWVNAKIVMERRGNRANIHIDFRLDLQNGSVGASDFDLISCAKLRTALGLNSFSCDTLKTRATVENLDADIYGDSASGIGAGLVGFIIEYNSSEDYLTIARIFQPPAVGPSFGAYMLSENYYTEAAVYHVDIWDAVVS